MSELTKFPVVDGETTFGLHLMLDAYNAPFEVLDDMKLIFKFLNDLPGKIGMKKLGLPIVYNADETASGFDPGGITGVVVLVESHASIHTFAERGFFTMDVYSCSDFTDQLPTLIEYTQKVFGMGTFDMQVVRRGTKYPMTNMMKQPKKDTISEPVAPVAPNNAPAENSVQEITNDETIVYKGY